MELNKIHNMDCLDGLHSLQDNYIDLTVTSPPYDNLRNYNGYSFDFENIAKELYRVTKNGGVIVWIVNDSTINGSETGTSFRQALYFIECGFNLHDTMIYEKNGMAFPEVNRYYPSFEFMFVLSKGKPKTTNLIADKKNAQFGNKVISGTDRQTDGTTKKRSADRLGLEKQVKQYGIRNNIWRYNTGYGKSTINKESYQHPAIFPEKLVEDHIISWSNKGDIVLDIFMGSGTTAKMAIVNDRKFIGFEISKEYCEIANRRINGLYPQLSIF